MSRLSNPKVSLEEVRPFAGRSRVHPNAAEVDIGAHENMVCVDGGDNTQIVRALGSYTIDLQAIGQWLQEHQMENVAMESTGVYWIPPFEELERRGFHCHLISSRSLRRVPGRKSDVLDLPMDTNTACLWDTGKLIPTRSRPDRIAHLAAPQVAIDRASRAAGLAYAKGVDTDEHPALAGIKRRGGCDRARDHSSDCCRRAQSTSAGTLTELSLQERRRRDHPGTVPGHGAKSTCSSLPAQLASNFSKRNQNVRSYSTE